MGVETDLYFGYVIDIKREYKERCKNDPEFYDNIDSMIKYNKLYEPFILYDGMSDEYCYLMYPLKLVKDAGLENCNSDVYDMFDDINGCLHSNNLKTLMDANQMLFSLYNELFHDYKEESKELTLKAIIDWR